MRNRLRILLLAAPILTIGCSKMPDREAPTDSRPIHVEIRATNGLDIESRTALEEDGRTVRWATGDRIALWALDAKGSARLEAQPFEMWHYDATYDEARFTGTISPMTEGTYTYCAASPLPASHEGTRVTYEIPATQNGAFDGSLDVMVAEPVTDAPALSEGLNEQFALRFHHKIHLLRITVPAGGNSLQEPIAALELEFPQPVVGRLTLDAANPDAAPELTEGSNKLTIRMAQPVGADEEICVYAAIAPITLTSDDAIQIKAVSTGGAESMTRTMPGKSFAAGHTTPVKYYIPDRYRITRIFFSLAGRDAQTDLPEDLAGGYGCSTLGEPVTAFTLTGPEGVDLGNGTNTRTFEVNRENLYEISYEGVFTDQLSGQPFTVTFESEHTIGLPYYESNEAKTAATPYSFLMPQLTADSRNTVKAFAVPYLLEEDFSSINQTTGESDNPGVGGTDRVSGDRPGIDLSQWGLAVEGWTGSRIGVEAGGTGSSNGAVRICARVENQQIAQNTYQARLDSAPLQGIKQGVNPAVRVSYNYKGGRWSMKMHFSWGLADDGPGNGNAVYSYGYTEEQGFQAGSVAIPHLIESNVILPQTEGTDRNQNQTYDNINYENSFVIPAATSLTRISWSVNSTMSDAPVFGANGNFWLYIDNVQVSIVNE